MDWNRGVFNSTAAGGGSAPLDGRFPAAAVRGALAQGHQPVLGNSHVQSHNQNISQEHNQGGTNVFKRQRSEGGELERAGDGHMRGGTARVHPSSFVSVEALADFCCSPRNMYKFGEEGEEKFVRVDQNLKPTSHLNVKNFDQISCTTSPGGAESVYIYDPLTKRVQGCDNKVCSCWVSGGLTMPKHIPDIKVGRRITLDGVPGMIKYDGYVGFSPGRWVGIELDRPEGTNSGRIKGRWYFDCKPDHGVFIRRDNYIKKFMGINNLPIEVGEDAPTVISAEDAIRRASGTSPAKGTEKTTTNTMQQRDSSVHFSGHSSQQLQGSGNTGGGMMAGHSPVSTRNVEGDEYTKKMARNLLLTKLSTSQASLQDFIATELEQLENPEQLRQFIETMPEKERELLRTVDIPTKLKTLTRQPAASDSKTKSDDIKNGDFALELAVALMNNDSNIIDALAHTGKAASKDIAALKQYKEALKIELAHCLARYGSSIKDSRTLREFISEHRMRSGSGGRMNESSGQLSQDAREINQLKAETHHLNNLLSQKQDDYLREEYKKLLAEKDAWNAEKRRLQEDKFHLQQSIASLESSKIANDTEKLLYRQKMEAQSEASMEKQMLEIEAREKKLRQQREEAEKNLKFIKEELKSSEAKLKEGFDQLERERAELSRKQLAMKEDQEYYQNSNTRMMEEKNNEIVSLRVENKSLRQQLQDAHGDKEMSSSEIAKQKGLLLELEQRLRKEQEKIRASEIELQEEKIALKAEVEHLKKELEESSKETEEQLRQMKRDDKMIAEAEVLHKMRNTLKEDRALLVAELEECKDRMEKLSDREETLEMEKRSLEQKQQKLEKNEKDLKKKMNEAQLIKRNYEDMTTKLEDEIFEKEKKLSEASAKMEEQKRDLERQKLKLDELQDQSESVQRELRSQEASLKEFQKSLEVESKNLKSDREVLMREQEQMSKNEQSLDEEFEELAKLKEAISEAKLEIQREKAEVDRQQRNAHDIVREASLSQEALDKIRTEVETDKEIIQEAKEMVSKMRTQNRELASDLQKKQSDIQAKQYALQDERLRLVERNASLNERESKLQHTRESLDRERGHLNEERSKFEEERAIFIPRLEAVEKREAFIEKKHTALDMEKKKLAEGLHQVQRDQFAIEREYSAIQAIQGRLQEQQVDIDSQRQQIARDRKSLTLIQKMVQHEDTLMGSKISEYRRATGDYSPARHGERPYPRTADRVAARIKEQVDLYEKKCWELEHEGQSIEQDMHRVEDLRSMNREDPRTTLHSSKGHKELSYELKQHADELLADISSTRGLEGSDKSKMLNLAAQIKHISENIDQMHRDVNADYSSLSSLAQQLDHVFISCTDLKSKLGKKEKELDRKSEDITSKQANLDQERLQMAFARSKLNDEKVAVSQIMVSSAAGNSLDQSLPGLTDSPESSRKAYGAFQSHSEVQNTLNTSAESHNNLIQRIVADEKQHEESAQHQTSYLNSLRQ
eukprot:Nk52_evm9s208 gene=Nk52_evmTU9s208